MTVRELRKTFGPKQGEKQQEDGEYNKEMW